MMRVIAASLLVVISACSSAGEDTPPVLEVTSPVRGTFVDADSVTVTGRVTDNGAVRVTVSGVEAQVAADGTFTATVPVSEGVALLETHAIDGAGNDVRDVRAVMAGTLGPTDGTVAGEIGARASASALGAVARAIATSAKGIDFTAAAKAMNPLYDNGGCLGATINVTSIQLSNIHAAIVPTAGTLSTDVVIENVVAKLSAKFKVACIGGSTTITLSASKAKIHGDLGARIASGAIATSLPSSTVSFEGFSLNIGGVPGAIEDLLRGEARKGIEKALAGVIRDTVPPLADKALAGLIAKPLSASLLGKDTSFTIAPTTLSLTPDELYVGLSTKLVVAGGEGGTYVTTPTTLRSGMAATQGLGVALDDDIINQLFAGLWAADALDQQLSIDAIPALGAVLDDNARSLAISFSLPPTVSTASGELELALGDMMVAVLDESGAEIQKLAMSVRTSLEAGPSQSGGVVLTVGAPTVFAQVLAQTDVVEDPLTDDQVEALVKGAWGIIGVEADDALSAMPMPTIAGVTLGAPTVGAGDGFVLADIPLQ